MSGLVLKLGPHERIMINGVVMENGDRRARLNVLTPDANVLRLRDAIHPDEANTPVRRVCYIAQLVLAGEADPEEARPAARCAGIEQLGQVFQDADSRAILAAADGGGAASGGSTRRCGRCAACCRARRGSSACARRREAGDELPAGHPAGRHRRLAVPRAHAGEAAGGVRERAPSSKREIAYFEENIGAVTTRGRPGGRPAAAEGGARRLRARGRDRQEGLHPQGPRGGHDRRGALATRMTDPAFAQALRRLRLRRRRRREDRPGRVRRRRSSSAYKTRAFEVAVGEADNNMRLAMNFRREIADARPPARAAAGTPSSARSRCAQVFEKAFGLPSAVRRRSTSTSRRDPAATAPTGCSAATR